MKERKNERDNGRRAERFVVQGFKGGKIIKQEICI